MARAMPWSGSGTATVVAASVDFRNPTSGSLAGAMVIRNTGATNSLQLSMDGGVTYAPTLLPGEAFGFADDVAIATLFVKSLVGSTTYEWVAKDTGASN